MKKITHAIIVAAGMGRRIQGKSEGKPKSLISVGGKTLLQRSLDNLKEKGVQTMDIVVGFERQQIEQAVKTPGVSFVFNPLYETTNNMASLLCALRQTKAEDFYYLHADILYDARLLDLALEGAGDVVLVTEEKPCDAEAMKVSVSKGLLIESSKEISPEDTFGEWTGIAALNENGKKQFIAEAEKLIQNKEFQAYDSKAFSAMARRKVPVTVAGFKNIPWIEIDTEADLDRASNETLAAL